jgi:hypothetical protein
MKAEINGMKKKYRKLRKEGSCERKKKIDADSEACVAKTREIIHRKGTNHVDDVSGRDVMCENRERKKKANKKN